jgi:ADP-L-glycero-D-manno-heptose 6-epimerase
MRILITGTNGFIGKNLLNELVNNHVILEINEDIFDLPKWYDEIFDLLDDFVPDVIFHVGACSDTLETDVNYMMTRNYEFTRCLSEWSNTMNSKLIYSSSAANYGTNGIHPSNLYGWSKYVAEQLVIKNGGIALRYFNVYGPLEHNKGKMASVAYQMLQKQEEGLEIKLFPLKPKRDFVYVKDIISANIFAMKNYKENAGDWYEVGNGVARTFEDVLDNLNIPYTYHDEKDIPNGYQFHTESKPHKWMFGWKSKWNLENGLKDYILKLRNLGSDKIY